MSPVWVTRGKTPILGRGKSPDPYRQGGGLK